jgi:hypothetical protein
MAVTLSLVLLVTILILLVLLFLHGEVRSIRRGIDRWLDSALREPAPYSPPRRPTTFTHHYRGPNPGFFVVWEWCDGTWHPTVDDLPPGADPGLPPNYPGAVSGYRAKTWVSGRQI